MKKAIALIVISCFVLLSFVGCSCGDEENAEPATAEFARDATEMFTARDEDASYDVSESIQIRLNGSSATADSESVHIDGTTVTITGEATYSISGTLDDGQLIVAAPSTAKVHLVLDGAGITSVDSAALYITSADKVVVTLMGDNTISNGGNFTSTDEKNIDGAVYSGSDLTFNGTGSLTVVSPVGHGIVCKDDLVLTGGTYAIQCAYHALDANDSVRMKNVTLTAEAGKDGIHAENSDVATLGFIYISDGTYQITAAGDGISAGSTLQIEGGEYTILAGGGYENGEEHSSDMWGGIPGATRPGGRSTTETTDDASTSMKGLKASTGILLDGGTYHMDTADDTLHSNASLYINGGSYNMASGDDAVHADETLTITSCTMDVTTCYEGLEALHIHVAGGDITLISTDDGLNAAGGTDASGTGGRDNMFGMRPGGRGDAAANSDGSILISGGTLFINASGDGIDANGTLEISGGHTTVVGPIMGDTATLDYDVSGVITGGTFIGTGASNMAQTFSDSSQGVLALSVGSRTAGTMITIAEEDGDVILTFEPPLSYQVVIVSAPEMKAGKKYTVTVGTSSGTFEAS